ncbi:MAG: type I-B CRISPR-associated protein Cas7/Cst2/DevR [Deltaproteobacteria bacterium]|nr:type I-B CRISPR-associated protein Cas7/Cst2/DevR [Deltaproteobacteria bacterium]
MSNLKNIFATVLTYAAPSSNYRGESEENRTVLQKITKQGAEYTVISPESMRNALREVLEAKGVPCNRRRLHNEEQLAVEFKSFPDASKYADDFLFGFMVADKDAIKKNAKLPAKRDSVLRMNLALATTPYRFDATFHQSPLSATEDKNGTPPFKNASTSALIHREIAHTAYQFPFALAGADCSKNIAWSKALLASIAELSNVAGGHARSYFEMSPKSVVARVSTKLVAGFDTYGFNDKGEFAELTRLEAADDLPPSEFYIGGELARTMEPSRRKALEARGAKFFDNAQTLIVALGDAAWG